MRETPSLLSQPAHIVIIVHGFRTFGRWQDALEILIEECPQPKVYKYNYGVSAAPILAWIATDHFRRDLVEIATQYPDARIDIVAHGCGAHVVGWGLLRCAKARCPKIHTIILASSVLKTSFPWSRLINAGLVHRVVNECATRDLALLFSLLVPFRGGAGIFGARDMLDGHKLRNNWYVFGHSGYFKYAGQPSDGFMRVRWLPALTTKKALPSQMDGRRQRWRTGRLRVVLENDAIKLLMWTLLPLFLLLMPFHRRSAEAQAARQLDLARHLAIQADGLIREQGSFSELSALLSIESLKRSHILLSDHALRRALSFLNSPSPVALSPEKVFVAKATPGPNSIKDTSAVTRVAQLASISPDGLYLAIGNADGTARVFDVESGKAVSEIPNQVALTAVAISSGGREVVTGCSDGTVRISELQGGSSTVEFKFDSAVTRARFSGDGQYLMTISQDKTVRLSSITGRRTLSEHRFDNQEYELREAALSFDERYFAIAFGPLIRSFNTSTWEQVQTFIPTSQAPLRLTFSSSGRYLAFVDPSGLVQILELRTGRILGQFRHPHVDDGGSVVRLPTSFSPDEKLLAAVNGDNSISLFDRYSGTEMSNIEGEDNYGVQFGRNSAVTLDQATTRHGGISTVREFAFSSDGRYLIVVYGFSTDVNRPEQMRTRTDQRSILFRYLVRPEDLIADACSRLNQNLTPQQWRQYLGDEPYRKTCPSLH